MQPLEHYGISRRTGFMPETEPLGRLPAQFEAWERVLDDISFHLLALTLREKILGLPLIDATSLKDGREIERAFLVLCLLCHAYVWGAKGQQVEQQLPANMARPWIKVAVRLRIRPISCHAALVYYNWRSLDVNQPLELCNLATLHTISAGIDESWFYMITMGIELTGSRCMTLIEASLNAQIKNDCKALSKNLDEMAQVINSMSDVLMRMAENCDPYIFYHRVRIYFSGWSNMRDLPNGLVYEGDSGEIEKMFLLTENHKEDSESGQGKKYAGGSAAQSALIHAIDIFLGVKHEPTRGGNVNFLSEMRYHMPGKFRDYLNDLEQQPSLHMFVAANTDECSASYNRCIGAIKQFRDKHIQIVTRYIIIQAKRATQVGQLSLEGEGYGGMGPNGVKVVFESPAVTEKIVQNDGLGVVSLTSANVKAATTAIKIEDDEIGAGSRGTGGTDILPFLKQSRDETAQKMFKL